MPLILPARTLDSGYNIDNSLRFDADNDRLERTPSSTGSRRKFTLSTWVKFNSGARRNIMAWRTDSNNAGEIRVENTGQVQVFEFQGGSQSNGFGLYSTRLLRDSFAWYNLFISVDTEQGTSGLIMYINGQEITYHTRTLGGGTNLDCNFNLSGTPMKIGSDRDNAQVWDGYMSEMHWIDGTIKLPTDFSETNENGVWIPKKYVGSYGTNGFYMEFKQSGDSANSSGKGADTSGEDNHFTPVSMGGVLPVVDTPTNNFSTLRVAQPPIDSKAVISNGNLDFDFTGDGSESSRLLDNHVVSSIAVSSGKWYCEVKITEDPTGQFVGITNLSTKNRDGEIQSWIALFGTDGQKYVQEYTGQGISNNNHGAAISLNDTVMIALDMDNKNVYFGNNGQWANGSGSYNQSSPTSAIAISDNFLTIDGDGSNVVFAFLASGSGETPRFQVNFGNPVQDISSGNADSEGFGNFEYAVPSGYFALCTKNLAEYG